MKDFPTLYAKDANGNVRVWWMTLDGAKHRTNTGIKGGAIVESGWTTCEGKNVGKSNATTPEEQAGKEVGATYKLKLKEGYFVNEEDVDNGPAYFEPMLAKKYGEVPLLHNKFASEYYSAQPKLDGIRAVVKKEMKSRNGREIVSAPHILALIKEFNKGGLIFDGELYNHEMKADFNSIVSLVKKQKPNEEDLAKSAQMIQYHIYDVYDPTRPDLKFLDRHQLLTEFMENIPTQWRAGLELVDTRKVSSTDEIEKLMADYLEDGYEGLMLRANEKYENKRSKFLQKYKEFQDEECTVIDVQEGLGNWGGKAKRIVLRRDAGTQFEAGLRATFEEAENILSNKALYIGKPATVRYQNLTPDGVPRFGVVTQFWPDGVKE